MIYLVSSFNRSGSSMMMRCLIAGGMPAVYDNSQENMNVLYRRGEYLPNQNGFYALDYGEFARPDFVEEYDGKLVKCPYFYLLKLPKHRYKLVFMQRNPAEIRKSMAAFTPGESWGINETITYLYTPIFSELNRRLLARGDVDAIILQYEDVVKQPLVEFEKLVKAGWKFDVAKAAECVTEALYRSRLDGGKWRA